MGIGDENYYGEMRVKSINKNEQVARGDEDISEVCKGLDVMTEVHIAHCDIVRFRS